METEPTLGDVVERLGKLERRVNGIDNRLERVEHRLEAFQSGVNTFNTAILAEMGRLNGRFDDLENLIRDSLNGQHGPAGSPR